MEKLEWPHTQARFAIRKHSRIKAFYYRWIVAKKSTALCPIGIEVVYVHREVPQWKFLGGSS
jgi:hypothetical protein